VGVKDQHFANVTGQIHAAATKPNPAKLKRMGAVARGSSSGFGVATKRRATIKAYGKPIRSGCIICVQQCA
jgi:hypothetical protein